ncbi:MAG: hypothetical protein GF411_01480 [Candidatus Lokiarchaeota archaeon]|nr:hypothetical protein [Candidatus Lokiarchaeota archaeon]
MRFPDLSEDEKLILSQILYHSLSTKFGSLFGSIEQALKFILTHFVQKRILTARQENSLVGVTGLNFYGLSFIAKTFSTQELRENVVNYP